MKKCFFCLLIGLVLVGLIPGCKKDYPKDIPDWLKKEIRENKLRLVGSKGDCYGFCLDISEYYEANYGFVYGFAGYYNVIYYDFDGNLICISGDGQPKCSTLNFSPQYQRFIYKSK